MIYLSGHIRPELARRPNTGFMLTPMMGNRPNMAATYWAADTGCFNQPEKFHLTEYLDWLEDRQAYTARCLFATAPDVVGDALATLASSHEVLPMIRDRGYRAALVAQDGLENLSVPWDLFDCLFIGGSTEWKLSESAYELAAQADERGKWVHQGRVNSWRRLKAAAVSGIDSADGTYLAFGPDINLKRLNGWLDSLNRQPVLTEVYRRA